MKAIVLASFFLLGMDYRSTKDTLVVAPYGIPSRQPPAPGRVVQIPEVRIGVSAQQVCGYTSWSTLQIDLPKKLLSKEYWTALGGTLKKQALDTVLDLSHALPSMLACNMSPTYCHIFNQAELMAGFEGELNFETCKIVDGLATKTVINEDLRQCMHSLEKEKKFTASEAREKCLTNDAMVDSHEKQGENIKIVRDTAEKSGHKADIFSMAKFIADSFPDSVKTKDQEYQFNSGGHTYSRRERSAKLMYELFPGIEVKGSAFVRNGGTFQPSIERELIRNTEETKNEIKKILGEMKNLKEQGYSGPAIVEKTQQSLQDKQKWQQKKEPPAIYRSTLDGSEPTQLVSVEQIFSLLPLLEEVDDKFIEQVIERISQSAAYIKTQDNLYDIYANSQINCAKPDYQGDVAQKNCKHIVENSKVAMEVLEHKMLGEERYRKVQDEISQMVNSVQSARANSLIGSNKAPPQETTRAIPFLNRGG